MKKMKARSLVFLLFFPALLSEPADVHAQTSGPRMPTNSFLSPFVPKIPHAPGNDRVALALGTDGRQTYAIEGAIAGGVGLGIVGAVPRSSSCSESSNCTTSVIGTGLIGPLIGVVIGGLIGSAIPKH
jgi:hypothetical protein